MAEYDCGAQCPYEPVQDDVPEGRYWIACRDGRIDNVLGLGTLTGNKLVVSPRTANDCASINQREQLLKETNKTEKDNAECNYN